MDGLVAAVRHAAKPRASRMDLTVLGQLAFEQTFWRRICSLLFHRKDGPTLMDAYEAPDQFWNRLASGLDDLAPEVVGAFLNLLTAGGPVESRSRRCGGWTVRRR